MAGNAFPALSFVFQTMKRRSGELRPRSWLLYAARLMRSEPRFRRTAILSTLFEGSDPVDSDDAASLVPAQPCMQATSLRYMPGSLRHDGP